MILSNLQVTAPSILNNLPCTILTIKIDKNFVHDVSSFIIKMPSLLKKVKIFFTLVQLEKKKQLEQFRTTIKTFGLRMEDAESSIREWGFSTE